MIEFDPERLLRTLADHEVEVCVIGAAAAWLQGNPSVTLSVDLMPRRDSDRLRAGENLLSIKVPPGPDTEPDREEQKQDSELDARDAVFGALALNRGIDAILTTDRAFDSIGGLERIDPADERAVATLIS